MKLRELEIENFGIFADRRLQFHGGLQLVCGPNEAGKSTLLQLIREVLFGFPHSSPYAFADRPGTMAATAAIELADGRRVRYRRRKGRKNTVVGSIEPSGDPVDESMLASLLGNANADLYRNVFGFSLAELAAGQESLRQERLTEALYGGGLGSLGSFQKVRDEIRTEHESLFSPSATRREINRLLAEIKDAKKAVAAAKLKPREYQQYRDEAARREQEVEQVRQQREEIQKAASHLKRLADALPPYRQLRITRDELKGLNVPEGFPANAIDRFQAACQRRDELAAELAEAEEDRRHVVETLGAIELKPQLVTAAAAVKNLYRRIEQIRGYIQDIPKRRQESATIKRTVQNRVQQLHPDWDLADVERYPTSLAQQDRLDAMQDELDSLEKQRAQATARRPDLTEQIVQAETALAQLRHVEAAPAVLRLADRIADYHHDVQKAAELAEQLESLQRDQDVLRRRLEATVGTTLEDPIRLPIPLEATLTEFRDRMADADRMCREAARSLEDAETALAGKRAERAELEARQPIPDRDQLARQRERRDAGWRLIRRKYIEDPDAAVADEIADWLGDASQSLPDRYERQVEHADRLADQRQAGAEQVARREQLDADVDLLQARCADFRQRLEAAQRDRQRLQQEWHAVWTGCNLEPRSPAEMLQWLRLYDELVGKARDSEKLELQRQDADQRIADFESALQAAIGGDGPVDQRVNELRRRAEAARKAVTLREQYEAELPKNQQRLERLDQQLQGLADQRRDWDTRWCQMLAELGLPGQWSVQTVLRVLRGLADARKELAEAVALDQRVADMEQATQGYQREVASLCRQIAPDLAAMPPEDAVVELAARVEQAGQAERDHQTHARQREAIERRIASKRKQLDHTDRQIRDLLAAAAAPDEARFEQVANDARRKQQLADQIAGLDRDVRRIASEEPWEPFCDELEHASADDLAIQRQRIDEQLQEIEQGYRQAVEAAAVARRQLAESDGASKAAELSLELESRRADLAAAVDRWAPLVIAQTLLVQAVERFEREHQPEMLKETGRLFSEMTRGRYRGVRRKLDEKGTLLLECQDGSTREPHALSTGTREQLYLAMRLAYVRHYCRDAEPLPLVMDDVLVNFDDQRAAGTLRVLHEVAKDIQIIFMTCHQSIIDLIAVANSDTSPICLTV